MAAETETSLAESDEQSTRLLRLVLVIAALALMGVVGVFVYGYVARPRPGWTGIKDKNFWDYLA
jgi:hypothetical protein